MTMTLLRAPEWERQAGESKAAFDGFACYREMNDRSYTAVARELHKSRTLIGRWGARHRWPERCAAYDLHLDRVTRKARQQAITKMQQRHADTAVLMLDKVIKALNSMTTDDAVSARDIPRWVEALVKVERQARGVANEVVENQAPAAPLVTTAEQNLRDAQETFFELMSAYPDDDQRSLLKQTAALYGVDDRLLVETEKVGDSHYWEQ